MNKKNAQDNRTPRNQTEFRRKRYLIELKGLLKKRMDLKAINLPHSSLLEIHFFP